VTDADATLRFLHVDLDAFFASVEELDDPSLVGQAVIVGGLGRRGVVAAANYAARKLDVHSALPMAIARRRAPHAAYRSPRMDRYQEISGQVMAILHEFTPAIEQLSVDEAFLDVAGARRLYGDGPTIAAAIRARVKAEAGLVISVGVATTKQLAKIASDMSKPNGLMVVDPATELEFLHALPIRRLWGVGPATAKRLDRFGIVTIGDVAATPRETLITAVGEASGAHLHDLAWNRDPRPIAPTRAVKSIGHEETFPRDIIDRAALEREVMRLSDLVGSRLRAAGVGGRTVTLKLRDSTFHTITRQRTLARPTNLGGDLADAARELLANEEVTVGIRLIGVSAHGLAPLVVEPEQLDLLGGAPDRDPDAGIEAGPSPADAAASASRRAVVEGVVDRVRDRFGVDAVGRATFVDGRRLRTQRRGGQWGPDLEPDPPSGPTTPTE
jgi:DNA polymerase-4